MERYSTAADAIRDLHMQGFTNDFQLAGNDLLWVQENLLIRAGDFAIIKYCKSEEGGNSMNELFVFGIVALVHNIKGILLSRVNNYSNRIPPVLVKKLNELNFQSEYKII